MISIIYFFYTLFYYQLNNILKPIVYNNFEVFKEDPFIFNPIIYSTNVFILYIFAVLNANVFFFSKIRNGTLSVLSIIYFRATRILNADFLRKKRIYFYTFGH